MKLRALIPAMAICVTFWTGVLLVAWTVDRSVGPGQQAAGSHRSDARRAPSGSYTPAVRTLIASTRMPGEDGLTGPMLPTPSPATTSSAAEPTMTFAVAVEPPTLRVGDRLTITMVLENHSDHQIHGLRVFSAGPWEEYAVDQVMPAGHVDMTWLGATFSTPLIIGPGQSGQVRITASPRAAGDSHFTFTPNSYGDRHLPRLTGQRIVFDAHVKVTP
jgi:hypothetical protein